MERDLFWKASCAFLFGISLQFAFFLHQKFQNDREDCVVKIEEKSDVH